MAERYELLEKIGAGSFATVYRARDKELGREVAVKQIHPRFLEDSAQLDRYWSESQLLASLQHPNIVTIYDVARVKGWLIMELMQGNIRDRLQGKQMDLRALRTTLAHCLRALKYLHTRGIIHGDVKPSNMMIDHRKRVKLGDFGLARRVSNVEGSLILGTAKYMAPEMVSEDLGDIGPESDLYSLGFAAYELLCGANFEELFPGLEAYGKDRQAAWMTWHAAPDRKLPEIRRVLDGVPDDLSHVIQKLIEKNPRKRYNDADLALADLKLDLKIINQGTGDTQEIAPPAADDGSKRRRWLAIGAFVLSTGLSLTVALWPSGSTLPQKGDQPVQGVIRKFDAAKGLVEYEDPLSGVPEEFTLPKKPRIRLVRPNEQDVFVLAKEIQAGDWLEIEPKKAGGASTADLTISRPVTSVATVKSVDYAGQRLMLIVEQGRVRDELTVNIPARSKLRLNGRVCVLQEIQPGDRLEIRHVIDPGGKRGHLASEVDAFRTSRSAGFVDHVDADARKIYVRYAAGGKTDELTLAPDATIKLRTGEPLPLSELAKGDRLEIASDAVVRELTVFRDGASVSGSIAAVDVDKGTLHLRDDAGKDVEVAVTPETAITLQRSPAKLVDLRPQVDRAILGAGPDESGKLVATTIDVTRGVLHDRWALIAGTSGYQDRGLSQLPSAVSDAGTFQNVLLNRYAVDPQWSPKLLDPTAAEFRASLEHVCKSANPSSQVIVALFGHVVRGTGADDKAYVAFKDFRSSDPTRTGVPVDWIVEQLDGCPAQTKMVLLEIGFDAKVPLEELLKGDGVASTSTTVLGLSATWQGAIPPAAPPQGSLTPMLVSGFAGAADEERNLRITADELAAWLEAELPKAMPPAGVTLKLVRLPAK